MATNQATAVAYLALSAWSAHLGLPLLVGSSVFFRDIQRHPAFTSMFITEILAGLTSCILLYANKFTLDGPGPDTFLCAFQASLLSGAYAMTSLALFGMIYQVFRIIMAAASSETLVVPARSMSRSTWTLLIAPYVVWITFAFGTATYIAHQGAQIVARSPVLPYCVVSTGPLRVVIAIFTSIVLAGTLVLEVRVLLIVVHFRRSSGFKSRALMDTTIRITAFALLISLAFILCLASAVLRTPSAIPDLVMSTMGTFIFFIFGTQRDILRAWARFLRLAPSSSTASSPTAAVRSVSSSRAHLSKGDSSRDSSSPNEISFMETPVTPAPVPTFMPLPATRMDSRDVEKGM